MSGLLYIGQDYNIFGQNYNIFSRIIVYLSRIIVYLGVVHRLVSWGGITPGHSAKFWFSLPVLTFNVSTKVIINVLWTGIWWILWTGENISLWLVQRRGVLPGMVLNRLFTHFLTFVRFLNISFPGPFPERHFLGNILVYQILVVFKSDWFLISVVRHPWSLVFPWSWFDVIVWLLMITNEVWVVTIC